MDRTRLRRVGLGVSTGALLGVGLLTWGGGSSAQPPLPIAPGLTGLALAEELRLELRPAFPPGCYYYVEASEQAGYCLDAVVTTNLEAWDVAQRLRGHMPTALDTQIFVLSDQISQAADVGDTATIEALSPQLEELLRQREAEGGGDE